MQGFDEKNVGLVIGQTFYIAQDYQGYFPERLVQNKLARWPMGCNCAYRKKVFDTIGYFEDEYFFYNNEDSEMAIRAVSQGWHYRRILEAIVYHQAMDWTAASLLRSARNGAIWPLLKKKYPRYYQEFKPPVFKGVVVSPQEYLYLVFLPIMVPLLLIRYLMHGKRDLKIFFIKWPVWLILRRWYVYYTAVKNRVFML
jgi:GT2 family glycosyltransferase